MAHVSVIIPTHNRAGLLAEAVASVLDQPADLEVIVVDDASTDPTAAVMASFAGDARVRYVPAARQGRSAARNHGVRLARGEFIGFLDSDDRYAPGSLAAHLRAFEAQPALGMTLGAYGYMDAHGQPCGEHRPWEASRSLALDGWLMNCFATPGSVLLRRAWFETVGGFDPALEMAEDWDLFLRLARAGCPMAWVKQVVYFYRQHPGASVHNLGRHHQQSLVVLGKLFGQAGLPPAIASQRARAEAWVHVLYARKYLAAQQAAEAGDALAAAVRLDPSLLGRRQVELLEFLLRPDDAQPPVEAAVAPEQLAAHRATLRLRPLALRRAQARVHMAHFFQAAASQPREAAAHLRAGLRLDPTWLLNRGVLAFCARGLLAPNARHG